LEVDDLAGTNVGSVYLDFKLDISQVESGFKGVGGLLKGLEGDFLQKSQNMQRIFSAESFAPAMATFASINEGTNGVRGNIDRLMTGVRNFGNVFRNIFSGARRDSEGLGSSVGRVSQGILTNWGNMAAGMAAGWNNVWQGISISFAGFINRIIDGLNAMIGGINRISLDIPRWLGGGTLGFNVPTIPNIPALAKGGIVQAPTLALVGERGREAVLPLENNTGWMVDLANMLADAVAAGGKSGSQKVVVELDGKKLAEGLLGELDEVRARRGTRN
jgi:hypothetical protein